MSELAKREENGATGESLTQSILLTRFWVLKRSADVDGADFLVQRQCDILKELRSRASTIQVLGIVQSKFFENANQVKVKKAYVLDNGQPRKEFFCSLHTLDDDGEPVHYFFSAEDVVKEFEVNDSEGIYWFALTKDRQYEAYKNPKWRFVLDKIERGMNHAEGEANRVFLERTFKIMAVPTMHYQDVPDFQYKLTIVSDVHMATVTDIKTNYSRPLEPRRDLYENQGDFYWGDDDIGCTFLAVSILAHHFNGVLPEDAPISALSNLLQSLDFESDHVIESWMLRELVNNMADQPNVLDELETEYPSEGSDGNVAFFEVVRKLGTELTIRCAKGIESVVETAGYSAGLLHKLSAIDIFLPGVEANPERIKKTLAVQLWVERDASTGQVVRIFDLFLTKKIH